MRTTGPLLTFVELMVSQHPSNLGFLTDTWVARPIQDYAKSILEIAEYELKIPNGNLSVARGYLEPLASSNAEDVTRAVELLKEVKAKIQERAGDDSLATDDGWTV